MDRTPRHTIYALINNLRLKPDQNIACDAHHGACVPAVEHCGLGEPDKLSSSQNNPLWLAVLVVSTPPHLSLARSPSRTISLYLLVKAGSGEIMNLSGSAEFFFRVPR